MWYKIAMALGRVVMTVMGRGNESDNLMAVTFWRGLILAELAMDFIKAV